MAVPGPIYDGGDVLRRCPDTRLGCETKGIPFQWHVIALAMIDLYDCRRGNREHEAQRSPHGESAEIHSVGSNHVIPSKDFESCGTLKRCWTLLDITLLMIKCRYRCILIPCCYNVAQISSPHAWAQQCAERQILKMKASARRRHATDLQP